MKKKSNNKRTIFILVPLLGLSLLAFVLSPSAAPGSGINAEADTSINMKGNYDVDDQKHEAPANHEPVFISIFKFIVNCNPFRKETNL